MTKWECLWAKVDEAFKWLVSEVAHVNGTVTASASQSANDFYPFSAGLSFRRSREPWADEDLVVSVSCHYNSGVLTLSADTALGNGYVISDGPVAKIECATAQDGSESLGFAIWMGEVVEFVRRERDVVCRELRPLVESR